MSHENAMTAEQERQMLEHFRTHTQGEPGAAVDALILAAAQAAVEPQPTVQRPRLLARLHAWFFGERSHQRWSFALAGVACLGIGVSLTWRNFEQRPTMYDAVPASASVPAAARAARPQAPVLKAAPAPEMRARVTQPELAEEAMLSQKRSVPVRSAESAATAVQAPVVESFSAAADAQPVEVEADVQEQLQQLLKLRLEGPAQEAETLLLKIKREHPDMDVEERLRQLQARE